MKKKVKISLLLASILVMSLALMAFRPWGGDSDEDGISDYTDTLAEVLDMTVDDLEAAEQAAREAAIARAVADGNLTQEQADAILEGNFEGHAGRDGGRFAFGGADYEALLAEELGITVEDLEAARQEAMNILMAQVVEDGDITQEQADLMQARSSFQPYLDDAYQQAYQNAIDAALEAGAITDDQAELLSENLSLGGRGIGGPGGHHGRMPHDQMPTDDSTTQP